MQTLKYKYTNYNKAALSGTIALFEPTLNPFTQPKTNNTYAFLFDETVLQPSFLNCKIFQFLFFGSFANRRPNSRSNYFGIKLSKF